MCARGRGPAKLAALGVAPAADYQQQEGMLCVTIQQPAVAAVVSIILRLCHPSVPLAAAGGVILMTESVAAAAIICFNNNNNMMKTHTPPLPTTTTLTPLLPLALIMVLGEEVALVGQGGRAVQALLCDFSCHLFAEILVKSFK